MIRQIARARISVSRTIILFAVMTACVALLSGAVGFVRRRFGIIHAEYLIYLILLILGIYAVARFMTEYRYMLVDDEMIVSRSFGRRTDILLVLRTGDIVSCGAADSLAEEQKRKADRIWKAAVRRAGSRYILFERDGKKQMLVYSPSADFLRELDQSIQVENESKNKKKIPSAAILGDPNRPSG